MKSTLSIAVVALLGKVSADELLSIGERLRATQKGLMQRTFQDVHVDDNGFIVLGEKTVLQMKKGVKPSDEVCDGDENENRQLEDEEDPNDPIVDNNGFVNQWKNNRMNAPKKALMQLKSKELPSNEICDGDSADDKELEDENDPNDDIVDDNGFVKQWQVQLKSKLNMKNNMKTKLKSKELPSNEVCDGDEAEDKELEDENDPNDDIVDDNGFVKQWQVQLGSKINLKNKVKAAAKNKNKNKSKELPSNEVCDGDEAEDKELEDENDPNDDIVDDNGFVKQWQVQLGSKVNLGNQGKAGVKSKNKSKELPSNEVCDGDEAEDKELEDENDPNDDIVDDNGFVKQWQVQLKQKNMGIKDKMMLQLKNKELPSNEVANGDEAEDKELEDEDDPNDDIVDDNGFVKQWQVQLDSQMNLGRKHHKKVQKKSHKKKRSSSAENIQLGKYSDELANGDKDDDKSIHEEEDMNDDVVDYNGHTNAGYGSMNPHKFREINKIMPGSHITVPRALGQKSAATAVKDGDDVAEMSAYDVHKWREMNHIMPGSHITVPRANLLQLSDPDDEEKDHSMGQKTPGHWWKDIQSLAQKNKEDDALFLQLESNIQKYSDELANGDEADDKDIHEEEDMNDDVVDVRGHTNAGYGALYTNSEWTKVNTIMPGSMITVPRALAQKKREYHQWY